MHINAIQVSIIVAVAQNGVIGVNNSLPWRLPDDLQHFKRLTMGKPMVMGRKTWESLPGLLPDRLHIVVSRQDGYVAEGALVMPDLQSALDIAGSEQADQAFVIGGAMLFKEALPMATNCYITEVQADFEGDVFFPTSVDDMLQTGWEESSRTRHDSDEHHAQAFEFVHLVRKLNHG